MMKLLDKTYDFIEDHKFVWILVSGQATRIHEMILLIFHIYFIFSHINIALFDGKQYFLAPSTQNHAESFGNYINKSVLDPKHAKFEEQLEFGHVQEDKYFLKQTGSTIRETDSELFSLTRDTFRYL